MESFPVFVESRNLLPFDTVTRMVVQASNLNVSLCRIVVLSAEAAIFAHIADDAETFERNISAQTIRIARKIVRYA